MADDRGMPGHTGEEMALRMAKNTERPEGSAPSPKGREEEVKRRLKRWADTMRGPPSDAHTILSDALARIESLESQLDNSLRTHSPEEPVGPPEEDAFREGYDAGYEDARHGDEPDGDAAYRTLLRLRERKGGAQ